MPHFLRPFSHHVTKARLFFGSLVLLGFVLISPFALSFFVDLAPIVNGGQFIAGDWSAPNPPLFWVEEDTTQVLIEWQAVADAVSYNVYRSTDNSTFTLLQTVAAPNLTHLDSTVANNTQYFYKVSAVDAVSNESDVTAVVGKRAFTKDVVIDDSVMNADSNTSGSTTASAGWDAYHVGLGGAAAAVLQNAVGGDNFSTAFVATGQTFDWQTNANLNGSYEVFVQYICDTSRGNAEYSIFAGASQLNVSPITRDQSKLDGVTGPDCGGQASSSEAGPTWVSLGTFNFVDQTGRVRLTAPTGEAHILADAVAFHRIGDITVAPMVDIDRSAIQVSGNQACAIGSAVADDKLRVVVTNWQAGYKLQLRYKIAGGGYNDFADASTFSLSPVVTDGTAVFEYLNSGDSPAGEAGWQARVVDAANNPVAGSNVDEETYYLTTDLDSLACKGSMQFGFETTVSELTTADYGSCPVTTADASRNGGQSAVQILKWSKVDGAVKYRLYGHAYQTTENGSISYTTPYPVELIPGTGTVGVDRVEESGTNSNLITYDTWATGENVYAYLIEAVDANNSIIGRTTGTIDYGAQKITNLNNCTFTVDRTPAVLPQSRIVVSNTPAAAETLRDVQNQIQNGSFESGLANWNVTGDVTLMAAPDAFTSPQDGAQMVKIGRDTNEGNPTAVNILTQEIPAGVRTLGFYYNMFTYDVDGLDEPGFMVYVNNELVYQRWASEIDLDGPNGDPNVDNTGWEYVGLDLSRYPAGTTLSLAFYAGNGTDNISSGLPHQTWVYVDNFSTNEAVVNADSEFTIITNPGDTAYYKIGTGPTQVGNTFKLSSHPIGQQIQYWSANGSTTEATNSFHVLFDNVKPDAVDDLTAEHADTNLFNLLWLSPRDDNQFTDGSTNAAWYEIKYSTTPITEATDWNSLQPVTIVTEDNLPAGGYRAPRPENEQEQYRVRVDQVAPTYYFAVKSFDAAGNASPLSNIAEVTPGAPVVVDNSSDIVLNEFLPNPVGDDTAVKPAGEWVELYNKSNVDKDVNGWTIADEDGHELVISAANSDNNLHASDAGETTVPANGWLVVYRHGDADFELDNTGGDTVRLYNGAMGSSTMVDEYTYAADALENKSYARIPDGSNNWVDPIPTPGRANVDSQDQLVPQAQLWQQDEHHLKFSLFDAVNYTSAHYVLEYTHTTSGSEQTEALVGDVAISTQQVDKKDLALGTCSTGGECAYHTGLVPASMKLTLTLTGPGIPDRTITVNLSGGWNDIVKPL
jgi:hypothetical protein